MEKKINIAELLKDCPSGMELDCTMFENVSFRGIQNGTSQIMIHTPDGIKFLNPFGCYHDSYRAKCVIFPKGKTTWEGFVPCKFKDGDILFVDCSYEAEEDTAYQYIFILNKPEFYAKWHSYCFLDGVGAFNPEETYLTDDKYHPRFATEEEKQKLFQAIKDHGYKWNAETKTLEKLIEPRFKVGDKIRQKNHHEVCLISEMRDNHYLLDEKDIALPFFAQDQWELVPNKFDIANMKPFESRVLVRDDNGGIWRVSFWGCLLEDWEDFKYDTTRGSFAQCIPYEGNEHLLGTDEDCDEYYKTWK